MTRSALAVLVLTLALCTSAAAEVIAGIDHVPMAVRDLESAQKAFRELGFSIKPGRAHEDGLRDAHVKFADGSGLELIEVPAAVDALTARYVELLQQGEGPAFLGLHVRDTARLVAALKRAGLPTVDEGEGRSRVPLPGLEWLFIVSDNRSPTDRAEHFAHPNGSTAMSRVWVAPDDPAPLRRLLLALGAQIESQTVAAPDPVRAEVAHLTNGDLIILPKDEQLIPGRPVVGATFTAPRARPAARTFGLWVEFRAPVAR